MRWRVPGVPPARFPITARPLLPIWTAGAYSFRRTGNLSATGNSLFVACQFSDSPISIPQELKKKDLTYEADEIGIVCPDYAGAIPKIVREFVQKASFKAPYMFSVITFGNACVNVAEYWDEFCQGQHFSMTAERLLQLREDRCVQCMTCERVCPHKNFGLGAGCGALRPAFPNNCRP